MDEAPVRSHKKTVIVTAATSLAAIAIVIVLVIVLPGAAVTSALLGSSGAAVIHIDSPRGDNPHPTFEGAMGAFSVTGRVGNSTLGTGFAPEWTYTGKVDGTSFVLTASLDISKSSSHSLFQSNLTYSVNGTYGSLPVKGTVVWALPKNLFSSNSLISMKIHGTVGSHVLVATGKASENSGPNMVATMHYTIS